MGFGYLKMKEGGENGHSRDSRCSTPSFCYKKFRTNPKSVEEEGLRIDIRWV